MDGILVSEDPSSNNDYAGSGGEGRFAPRFAYSELFESEFPYYLAIGMTYDQYWNDDPGLVKAYRKSAEIKRDLMNEQAWLQGRYIYDALLMVSPLLRAFSNATNPIEYHRRPYDFGSGPDKEARDKADRESEEIRKGKLEKAKIESWFIRFNQQFKEKEEGVKTDG